MTKTAAQHTPRRSVLHSRVGHWMLVLLALVFLGGIYAAFSPASQAAPGPATNDQQLSAARGEDLFSRGCSTCHGLNAEGTQVGPSLIGVGAAAVDFQVGTGRMPLGTFNAQADRKPPRYDQASINDLAAYVASLAPGPAIPNVNPAQVKAASIPFGGELFRTNCAQCHNAVGEGGILGDGINAPILKGADDKEIYEAMLTGPEQMPIFPDTVLSPSEKVAVIAYLDRVNKAGANTGGHPIGRLGPVDEGLVAFIVGMGLCVVLTLWIGTRI